MDALFQRVQRLYARGLERALRHPWLVVLVMLLAMAPALLVRGLPKELAPLEDRGAFVVSITGPEGAGLTGP